jgi:NAD(P)H dehydrogenase (quinone)
MSSILVVYYSSYGHIEAMARAQAEGAARVPGCGVTVKRVAELVPAEIARASGFRLDQPAPVAEPEELEQYDGILFGTPTRFGNMAAQMRNFLDRTGALWARAALVGKVGSVFCSTASQHGGQETTITSFHSTLLHHGMIVVGLPYTLPALTQIREVAGGGPYGASCVTGADAELRMPSALELEMCRHQGEHVARITSRLVAGARAA